MKNSALGRLQRHACILSFVVWASFSPKGLFAEDQVDYLREIRPILSDNCYTCHGPDVKTRQADLRLDLSSHAFKKGKNGLAPITPGKLAESLIISRIESNDSDMIMPPSDSNKKLSPHQIQRLKKWVEQGAKWGEHWAFLPPVRPSVPTVTNLPPGRNAIDQFIFARLAKDKLRPSAEADRVTLIRRLSLDLLGLPPSLTDVDAFVSDARPDAYERLVDRLLASPHFGEKMAQHWLDLARYADTNGYHIDNHRDMWKWRDWVIKAFQSNKRFDEFTIEQIAGDMLPKASMEQQIASGFNRNCMVNFEGGAIEEEYATKYVVDRVVTTSTAFLGLTMGCCECHDHKYDPISQKEFYQFYAFFNNVPEKGLDGQRTNPVPSISVPSSEHLRTLATMDARVASLNQKLNEPNREVEEQQKKWERLIQASPTPDWAVVDFISATTKAGATLSLQKDGSILASGNNPDKDSYTVRFRSSLKKITGLRLEVLPDPSLPSKGPGRAHNGNFVMTEFKVNVERTDRTQQNSSAQKVLPDLSKSETKAKSPDPKSPKPAVAAPLQVPPLASKPKLSRVASVLRATASHAQADFEISNVLDRKQNTGWAILPYPGKAQSAVFEFEAPIDCDADTVLAVTLEFRSQFPQHGIGHFRITASDDDLPHDRQSLPPQIQQALAVKSQGRPAHLNSALKSYYRLHYWPQGREFVKQIAAVEKQKGIYSSSIPTTMVMQEMANPRNTNILLRGDYRSRGDVVQPNIPAIFRRFPENPKPDRMTLARWLVDPQNPLVARVTVNRYWQYLFGIGLVRTSNDFGTRGEMPSHPELLDWLATEFLSSGWDVKHMIRLMVTSATYRQMAVITPSLREHDPENRLLAHAPQFRLEAEGIRDNALAISGLLVRRIGGPSVRPYQPPGLWEDLAFGNEFSSQRYELSKGDDLHRRGLYTYWKRSSPYPSFVAFDAPNRELCTVARPRTNTPLQALVLLNDPVYVEAARALGQRMIQDGGADTQSRLRYGFRLCVARSPSNAELAVLEKLVVKKLADFRNDKKSAASLIQSTGSPATDDKQSSELAAWTMIGNVLLNLSETITKG